jgi:hypothetical protein
MSLLLHEKYNKSLAFGRGKLHCLTKTYAAVFKKQKLSEPEKKEPKESKKTKKLKKKKK